MGWNMVLGCGSLSVYLAIASWSDWKKQLVSINLAAAAGVTGLIFEWIFHEMIWMEWFFGLLPGLCMILVSRITKESIGYGDGAVILACGCFLGFWGCVEVLMLSSLFLLPAALFCLVVQRKGLSAELPFIPFVLAGYLVWVFCGGSL